MQLKKSKRPLLEKLEDRTNPSSFTFTGSGTTLTITQTQGVNPLTTALTITDDGVGGMSITDTGATPASTVSLPASGFSNLTFNFLGTDTAPITYTLTGARAGNLTLNVANTAARTLSLNLTSGVGGNLSVTSGNGALTVTETGGPIVVAGNGSFNGGAGTDVFNLVSGAASTFGGSLTLTKFNNIDFNDSDSIGGNLLINNSGEGVANDVDLPGTTVGGSFTYIGGNRADTIDLTTTSVVGTNLSVNFGNQFAADVSNIGIGGTSVVGGTLSVTGSALGREVVTLAVGATLAGSATLNMAGTSGATAATGDVADFQGTFAGASFNYIGGVGTDTITYNVAAGSARARFTAQLGAGVDSVAFTSGAANPISAYVDFGAGADSVTGTLNFPFTFLNLP